MKSLRFCLPRWVNFFVSWCVLVANFVRILSGQFSLGFLSFQLFTYYFSLEFMMFSFISKLRGSNFRSAGLFGGRWQLDVARFVTTLDLMRPCEVLCYSKFQDHDYRSRFLHAFNGLYWLRGTVLPLQSSVKRDKSHGMNTIPDCVNKLRQANSLSTHVYTWPKIFWLNLLTRCARTGPVKQ